ncbi:hypothetical protein DLAC_02865 [Tieghemostelium lacteum]|uniref:Phospholipid/glycerol acyltransferase domain-containing protein n=1 Tax=Tieghemostelium lacteum TaxID=361077 RepID=A0A152A3H5_TIELA|nr:hypothetical protein DLAC_02865 [Tieghemostelium lacteum]|eukprot:KYR00813.1 hypothetical protein DLAC_02865 [Tieghemostelium lacteum]
MGFLGNIIRGILNFTYVILSSCCACVFFMFPPLVMIRPFSKTLYYKINNKVAGSWFRYLIFQTQVVNQTTVKLHGSEQLKPNESVILMMNHPSEIDWLYSWVLANRVGSTSCIKVILKDQIKYVPGIGWGCDNLDFVYLTRHWEFDEQHIQYKMELYTETHTKPWLVIFPEGTDFDKDKQLKSWAFSEKNGHPKFNNVLLPRHKGLHACIEPLRTHQNLDAIYDITIGYESKPTIFTCMIGTNPTVNIDIKRIPISEVPKEEDALQKWIYNLYDKKDKLLQQFKDNGNQFPSPYIIPKVGLDVYFFSILWYTFMIMAFYLMSQHTLLLYYFIAVVLFFISSSRFKSLREFRGLQLPQHTKKQ